MNNLANTLMLNFLKNYIYADGNVSIYKTEGGYAYITEEFYDLYRHMESKVKSLIETLDPNNILSILNADHSLTTQELITVLKLMNYNRSDISDLKYHANIQREVCVRTIPLIEDYYQGGELAMSSLYYICRNHADEYLEQLLVKDSNIYNVWDNTSLVKRLRNCTLYDFVGIYMMQYYESIDMVCDTCYYDADNIAIWEYVDVDLRKYDVLDMIYSENIYNSTDETAYILLSVAMKIVEGFNSISSTFTSITPNVIDSITF